MICDQTFYLSTTHPYNMDKAVNIRALFTTRTPNSITRLYYHYFELMSTTF